MARRESLGWGSLAIYAGIILLAGSASKKRATQGSGVATPRAGADGTGDNDVISYVIDTDGTIFVRTPSEDVDWGTPKIAERFLPKFRAMVDHWGPIVDDAGTDYRLPSSNIAGIMWGESEGDPRAQSPAGALGLMQLMPYHFTDSERPNAFEPRLNIRKGASLLATARAGFRDLVQMASAYNAGGPQGPANGPWTNEAWLAANRKPSQTSRWGYASEPGYIDRVVAANNTYLALRKGQA